MRVLVAADVHGNLAAFEAVIADARRRGGFDLIACVGDVVDYGPAPGECLTLLRSFPHVAVAGNHDWGAVGKVSLDDFNPAAAEACRWAGAQLDADQRTCLEELPLTATVGDLTLAHGSPRDPIWEYMVSGYRAGVLPPLQHVRLRCGPLASPTPVRAAARRLLCGAVAGAGRVRPA